MLTSLGDVLRDQRRFAAARQAYEERLRVAIRLADMRGQAVVLAQLGALALNERDYADAECHYHDAVARFQARSEPANEAVCSHQPGVVLLHQRRWREAERRYRQSLLLRERLGGQVGSADTCAHLAIIAEEDGRPVEAERWLRRSQAAFVQQLGL